MIFHAQMCKLMNYDIIDHIQRSHDQPPCEIQSPVHTARSPARFRGTDPYPFGNEVMALGIFLQTFRDDFICARFVPFCKVLCAFLPHIPIEREAIVKLKSGSLRTHQFQVKGRTEEKKSLAIVIMDFSFSRVRMIQSAFCWMNNSIMARELRIGARTVSVPSRSTTNARVLRLLRMNLSI
jgi:hypothetical protein